MADFVAKQTCHYLEEQEQKERFAAHREAVKAEREARENLKASTVKVIKDMTSPLTMEEQYEAAIDAALKKE